VLIAEGDASMLFVVLNTVMAMLGLLGVAAGLNGYFMGHINPVFRVLLVLAGVCVMVPWASFASVTEIGINAVGIVIVAGIGVFQKFFGKKGEPGDTDDSTKGDIDTAAAAA
jgi:TRAP-type uncharacterized transport system fused permease subunit